MTKVKNILYCTVRCSDGKKNAEELAWRIRGGGVAGIADILQWLSLAMRPKAREMTQHGGPPVWLEQSDPTK